MGPYNVAVPSDVSHARFYASTTYFFSNVSLGVSVRRPVCVAHTRELVHGNYCFYNNGPCPLEVSFEMQFQGQIPLSQLQLFFF